LQHLHNHTTTRHAGDLFATDKSHSQANNIKIKWKRVFVSYATIRTQTVKHVDLYRSSNFEISLDALQIKAYDECSKNTLL